MAGRQTDQTFVKICGITRLEDAETLIELGADAFGLIFYEPSPRFVDRQTAKAIARCAAGAAKSVGVFVDAPDGVVRSMIDRVGLDILQFQGSETPAFCASFGLPFLRALRVVGPLDYAQLERDYAGALGIMLDASVNGLPGGTGHRFDWRQWPQRPGMNYVLAGGLTPENVNGAVRRLRPWGVDVSTGVESGVKGIKESGKMRRFVEEVRRADAG